MLWILRIDRSEKERAPTTARVRNGLVGILFGISL